MQALAAGQYWGRTEHERGKEVLVVRRAADAGGQESCVSWGLPGRHQLRRPTSKSYPTDKRNTRPTINVTGKREL